ncbi:PREDICTED: uncharacterized protein LOC108966439 [Bactrocera latifrons]|uniref:uncharacterized protein LOC108966439 n=1 Tax=Bactrocera latifrons TaxID=174628 RepID=UPI0008DC6B3C|nr:PREDICTED: uncharacterized protein LOC108966439 [Bactrocera latifrons]
MQLEAKDSFPAKRIIVKLIEEALQQYERNTSALDIELNIEVHTNHLLQQLKALLGDVLVEALCILDEQSIILYTNESCAVAEIQIKHQQYASSIWLFPGVNYCNCKQFNERVLGLSSELEQQNSVTQTENVQRSYTCAHVLALRLAQLLRPKPSTYKVEAVTTQQFNNLNERMECSFLEIFKENSL